MKDELLQQLEALRGDPLMLLNLPESDRLCWEDVLFELWQALEDRRLKGVMVHGQEKDA